MFELLTENILFALHMELGKTQKRLMKKGPHS